MKESFIKGRAVFAGIPVLIALMIACSGGESGTTLSDDGALNSFMLSDGYTACYDINGNNACDADEASAQVSNGYYEPSKLSNDGNEGAPLIAYKAGSPTHYAVNGVFSPLNTLIYSKARDAGKSYDALYEDVYEKLGTTAVQDSFLEFVGHGLDAAYRTGEEIDQVLNPGAGTQSIKSFLRNALNLDSGSGESSAPPSDIIASRVYDKLITQDDLGSLMTEYGSLSDEQKEAMAKGILQIGENEIGKDIKYRQNRPGAVTIGYMPAETDSSTINVEWNMWYGNKGHLFRVYLNDKLDSQSPYPLTYDANPGAQQGSTTLTLIPNADNNIRVSLCYQDSSTQAEICSNDVRLIKQGSAANVGKNPGVPFIDWMPVVADKSPYQISWNMWWGINGQTWKLYINNTEKCSQTFSKVSVMSAQNGTCSAELTKGPNEIYVELCNDTYCSKSAVSRILYDANATPDAPVAVGDPVPPSMPPVYVITPPVETPQPERGAPETPAPLPAGSAPTTGIAPAKPHIAWFAPRTLAASNTISWNIWYGTGASSATIVVTAPDGAVTESNPPVSGTNMKSGSFTVSTPTDGQYTLAVKVSNAYGSSQSDEKVLTKYTENQQDPIYAPLPTGTPSQPISASLKDCSLVDIGEDLSRAGTGTAQERCMTALRADDSFGGTYTAGTHTSAYKPAGNKKIIAYFAEWGIYLRNYHVKDIPAARLTHLYYAFLDAKSNGDLSIIDYYAALDKSNETDTYLSPSGRKGNLKQLWLLKQKFPHLNMCFSVGGWTKSDNLYAIAASETLRNRMAESALRFAKDYKFDCIDIDWEFPVLGGEETHLASKADRDNFTKLIDALYAKLNPEGIKLTAAVSASDLGIKALNYPAFVDKLDSIILMTYDFNGAWNKYTGHQASLFPNNHPAQTYKVAYNKHWNISSALENVIKQFPDPTKAAAVRDKIMLGVAFYGRTWSGATQKPVPTQPIVQITGPGSGPGPGKYEQGVDDYKQVAASTNIASESSLPGKPWTYIWDDEAKSPMLYKSAGSGKYDVMTYTDRKAAYYQACYAKHKAGGVIIWELSGDEFDSSHTTTTGGHLLKQINRALNGSAFESDANITCSTAPVKGNSAVSGTSGDSTVDTGSGFAPTQPDAPANTTPVSSVIDKDKFNQIFPARNGAACKAAGQSPGCDDAAKEGGFITYENFIAAAKYYPEFGRSDDPDPATAGAKARREVAAFLANIAQETTGGWGPKVTFDGSSPNMFTFGGYFTEELGYSSASVSKRDYDYCAYWDVTYGYACGPVADGGFDKSYHGRGPIQLSWNYNYGLISDMLGVDLLKNPEKLIQDGVLAFRSGLWFWMTPQPPKPSAHDVMQGNWKPTAQDLAASRTEDQWFAMTINIINGGHECNQPSTRAKQRVGHFARIMKILGDDSFYSDTTINDPKYNCSKMRSY